MLILELNITHNELLDFASEIVEKYSTEKEIDMIQITKFREIVNNKNSTWLPLIEGWCVGLSSRYDVSMENYIRKQKLINLREI